MKRITIYDVAKEADVSLATVSRVINDSNVVREDTRLRVQQAIEKLSLNKMTPSTRDLIIDSITSCILEMPLLVVWNMML